jgi:hypothetical protein
MPTFRIIPILTLLLISKILTGKYFEKAGLDLPFGTNFQEKRNLSFKKSGNDKKPGFQTTDYPTLRKQIENQRLVFARRFDSANNELVKSAILKEAGDYLAANISEKMLPLWYGTEWAFDGHTETPGKGKIACGYLVSTVLQHAGFNLNRFKIAQQAPSVEVMTYHEGIKAIEYPQASISDLCDSIRKNHKEGLYIFGQQFHVGFMLYKDGEVSLIHSCYLGKRPSVAKERMAESLIMYDGSYIFFGEISTNPVLMEKWLKKKPIKVYTVKS